MSQLPGRYCLRFLAYLVTGRPARSAVPEKTARSSLSVAVFAWLALCLPEAGQASDARAFLIYGGLQAKNSWNDIITEPGNVSYYDDGLVGTALSRSRRIGQTPFLYGLEGQANYHFGSEGYGEFNLPVFIRYQPGWKLPLRGLAFGLGPSITTRVPDIEIDKGGASQTILFYWYLEAEFGRLDARTTAILRLHHRSYGFGTFEKPGSSNAVVLGLRRQF